MRIALLALVLAGPASLHAQSSSGASDPIAQTLRDMYGQVKKYAIAAAEQVPESQYGFRPAADVRTFGQLIGHLADAQYLFCSSAKGEPNPHKESIEKTVTAKAALQKALADGFAYCDGVYGWATDAVLTEPITMFGQSRNRLWALATNVSHDNEHYGNIVTYMRIKGMVPPSSARTGP